MTSKSEHAYRTALTRLTVTLSKASKAAHALTPDDEEEADFDRIMRLGFLTDTAAQLCPAHTRLLEDIADVLRGHPDDARAEPSEEAPTEPSEEAPTPSGRTEH